ncbi:Protein of unknown function [Pyronema omphalodes CBS 100304]|uniref:Uncharacterized protein n=1 Tax=Pyronema omphalodes (strain CBS 100304) TaxID=1076935 RepID=U4LNA8_PYROM|nr:Protein of unknown function [Pyronema omphalodes CBS 100304]
MITTGVLFKELEALVSTLGSPIPMLDFLHNPMIQQNILEQWSRTVHKKEMNYLKGIKSIIASIENKSSDEGRGWSSLGFYYGAMILCGQIKSDISGCDIETAKKEHDETMKELFGRHLETGQQVPEFAQWSSLPNVCKVYNKLVIKLRSIGVDEAMSQPTKPTMTTTGILLSKRAYFMNKAPGVDLMNYKAKPLEAMVMHGVLEKWSRDVHEEEMNYLKGIKSIVASIDNKSSHKGREAVNKWSDLGFYYGAMILCGQIKSDISGCNIETAKKEPLQEVVFDSRLEAVFAEHDVAMKEFFDEFLGTGQQVPNFGPWRSLRVMCEVYNMLVSKLSDVKGKDNQKE